jgi:hypothetical protein
LDGSPTHANACPLTDRLVGVVDHHPNPGAVDCPFADIRTSYGACSSIIAEYWTESGWTPDQASATPCSWASRWIRIFSPAGRARRLEAHRSIFLLADLEFSTRGVKGSLSSRTFRLPPGGTGQDRRGHLLHRTPLDCTHELNSIIADFSSDEGNSRTVIVESRRDGTTYRSAARPRSFRRRDRPQAIIASDAKADTTIWRAASSIPPSTGGGCLLAASWKRSKPHMRFNERKVDIIVLGVGIRPVCTAHVSRKASRNCRGSSGGNSGLRLRGDRRRALFPLHAGQRGLGAPDIARSSRRARAST